MNSSTVLNCEEEQTLIGLLGKVTPQTMTAGVFNAVAKLFRLPAIELVCFRKGTDDQIEVLLSKRPDDDPLFPGQWHSAGTIARLTDATEMHSLDRLAKTELGILGLTMRTSPRLAGPCYSCHARGGEVHLIYVMWLDILEPIPAHHQFFPVNNLPEPFMEHHREVIRIARTIQP